MSVLDIIFDYRKLFLEGLLTTLGLISIIYPTGLVFGTLVGVISNKYKRSIGLLVKIISTLVAATPILVILFWMHYPFQYMLNIVIDPFYTSAFSISIVCIFLISDIITATLNDFPKQYLNAAKVCGMKSRDTILRIQLPIVFRQVLPPIINVLVIILQATLFTSLISVNDLFRVSQQINAEIYKPVEIYSALGIFYIVICLIIFGIAYFFKRKFTRNFSEH